MKYFSLFTTACCLLFLAACTDSAVRQSSTPMNDANASQSSVPDAQTGREVWVAVGAMNGLGNTQANGVAEARFYDNGTYKHDLRVNIHVPEKGEEYHAWLVHPDNDDVVSLGVLQSPFQDARHVTELRTTEDLRAYTKVLVTRETAGSEPKAPSAPVVLGELRVAKQ